MRFCASCAKWFGILIQFVNFEQIALLQRCKSIVGKIHVGFFVVIFQLVQMNGAWTDCYLSITSDFPPRSAPPRRKSCVIKPSCDGPRHPLDRWSKNLGGRNRNFFYNISSNVRIVVIDILENRSVQITGSGLTGKRTLNSFLSHNYNWNPFFYGKDGKGQHKITKKWWRRVLWMAKEKHATFILDSHQKPPITTYEQHQALAKRISCVI